MDAKPKQVCRICQHENRPENNFCTRCGISLKDDEQNSARLVYAGNESDEKFPLTRRENRIGRDLSNEIVLHDAQISKRHAVIIREGERFLIEDSGSKNGVFVDGKKAEQPTVIENGSLLKLGATLLKFECA